jgi:malonate transporter
MVDILYAIAPIFILIVLGNVLRRNGIPSIEFWNLNDKLVYWVLFPALLFYSTSTLNLSGEAFGSYAIVILLGFGGAVIFSLIAAKAAKMPPAVATSVLQGSARHNTFIAMAVAESLFGMGGLSLAALVTAVLIPVTNIVVVSLMVGILPHERSIFNAVARDLLRNPLLIAVLLGVTANLSGVGVVPVLHDVASILGAAALPVVLLCIGANIRIREMQASVFPTVISMMGKFIAFPLAMFAAIHVVGLTGMQALIAMVFACVPTAASAFTLARQMGGDAPLMAAIVTLQTAVSFIFLPLVIVYLAGYFGVPLDL